MEGTKKIYIYIYIYICVWASAHSNFGRIFEPPGIGDKFEEMCFGTLTTLWRCHLVNCNRRFEETYCWSYSRCRRTDKPSEFFFL